MGCFDILHIDHIELFRFAKKYAHIVIVGLENDNSIRKSKGNNRPIFNYIARSKVLSELESVDYIFKIKKTFTHESQEASSYYTHLTTKVGANFLLTNQKVDKFWQEKEKRASRLGIKLIKYSKNPSTSTTMIENIIRNEI